MPAASVCHVSSDSNELCLVQTSDFTSAAHLSQTYVAVLILYSWGILSPLIHA